MEFYEFNVSIFSGLKGVGYKKLWKDVRVILNKNTSPEDIIDEALRQVKSHPKTHHCEVSIVRKIDDIEYEIKDKVNEVLHNIEQIMMSISVRKTEKSKICFENNYRKPDFSDLDWCFEQLYYLKKEFQ
ncbi:hypothetical protein FJQ98_16310 [Lysinibacillus agricola]|uniref:Uncharacterized protein n=1 Tax=Lysinibacillus agricola TaxID=2590012 RepID=A0ABX7ALM6_9BACI|nr:MULTISPECIES: hypothetical protein [Lysinibacillus]KOS61502.1 hypothetical protein AN161_18100 [Lysinibacillus sp. FJAT-14222]QQP10808.1 hypothetical protein FJQ98_16310 [Lysinibacillus agricola]